MIWLRETKAGYRVDDKETWEDILVNPDHILAARRIDWYTKITTINNEYIYVAESLKEIGQKILVHTRFGHEKITK